LSLRFTPLLAAQEDYAKMAIIISGAAFGLIPFTWHPSKVMWGFAATSAGLALASLSILSTSKIATSVIVLLIPFLDGTVTVLRRLIQKKNPLKGDRGHLHHLLMERGWKAPQIAIFYWISTMLLGLIGIFASERYLVQITLMLGGVIAFVIILLNLKSKIVRGLTPKSE
jgi:UDP-GlcNAc:undecaprenyl-phosphate GlcNAc-1-phosphate transferase